MHRSLSPDNDKAHYTILTLGREAFLLALCSYSIAPLCTEVKSKTAPTAQVEAVSFRGRSHRYSANRGHI